jgi:hypothetical protein
MNPLPLFLTAALLLAPLPSHAADPPAPTPVTIKSTDGKSFEATVLALGKDSVKVKRKDGKEFDVPLSRLTPESIADIQKAAPPKKEAPAPPGKKPAVAKPTNPDQIETKFSVKCGEKVCVSFEQKGDTATKVTVVKTTDDKTPHFDVDFHASDDGIVTAIIHHTYPNTIHYRCLARNKGSKTWYASNMIPAPPNFHNGETWKGVEEIVLFDFKFTDEKRPE